MATLSDVINDSTAVPVTLHGVRTLWGTLLKSQLLSKAIEKLTAPKEITIFLFLVKNFSFLDFCLMFSLNI